VLVRPWLSEGNQLDIVSSSLSLFAFAEILGDVAKLAKARLLLPPEQTDLALLGLEADRGARNRLQARWLARRLAAWLVDKVELRRAPGLVPQGAIVLRDGGEQPNQAVLGSFSFSSDGLGITPGKATKLDDVLAAAP